MLAQKYEYSVVSPGTEEYEEYCALRHEVFCAELGRLPSCDGKSGKRSLETDDFDAHSVHVLCRSVETGEAVGCARLILPSPRGLNVLSRYKLHSQLNSEVDLVGEIGRLAISSKLRRYRRDTQLVGPALPSDTAEDLNREIKRDGPTVALGLYREVFRLASEHGITHCYAAMEPSLSRMLNRLGFPFHEAGPINHAVQPARQPYLIGANALRTGLASRNSCLYRFIFGGEEPTLALSKTIWASSTDETASLPFNALAQTPG
ncbi:MAG: PEP-CTERM/exosortase system-associated acyltransferase [Hydrogenophaga sp.]|nr:PEP-CTERM/exosortase system-associated acyltransferase [Hydrogenophaga sp.]